MTRVYWEFVSVFKAIPSLQLLLFRLPFLPISARKVLLALGVYNTMMVKGEYDFSYTYEVLEDLPAWAPNV